MSVEYCPAQQQRKCIFGELLELFKKANEIERRVAFGFLAVFEPECDLLYDFDLLARISLTAGNPKHRADPVALLDGLQHVNFDVCYEAVKDRQPFTQLFGIHSKVGHQMVVTVVRIVCNLKKIVFDSSFRTYTLQST